MADTTNLKGSAETVNKVSSSSDAEPVIMSGRPTEQFEIEEPRSTSQIKTYPVGIKLWLNLSSMLICLLLRGLDLTIVAVAVPSLTNEFKTLTDIGWYSAAYGLSAGACNFFFGKVYTLWDTKVLFILSIIVFWTGSTICTFASSSKIFIAGRAVSSVGSSFQAAGMILQLNAMFPPHKRPFWWGFFNFTQSVAMVAAPVIGGALIQVFSWRACFGINVPLNILALIAAYFTMESNRDLPNISLPFKEKLQRLDLIGSLLSIPALVLLLVGLQWGGITYGWRDPRIITVFVLGSILLACFAYLQHKLQGKATIPPHIVKKKGLLAAMWFNFCCDATLAITEAYLAIYFQGVRGLTPALSGVLGVPMIVGLAVSALASGPTMQKIGYYTPLMLFTSVVAPIASGLLTTLNLDAQLGKAAGLLGMLGFALGIGMSGPAFQVNTSLLPSEVSIGVAIIGFGACMGSSLGISAAAILFQQRLKAEIGSAESSVNITMIEQVGLSDIRRIVGEDRLKGVLTGYDKAVSQTLYLPMALTVANLLGSAFVDWNSVKKKED